MQGMENATFSSSPKGMNNQILLKNGLEKYYLKYYFLNVI